MDSACSPGCTATIALVTWFDTLKPGGLRGGVMLDSTDIDSDFQVLSARGLLLTKIKQQPWAVTRCSKMRTATVGF